MFEFNPRIFFQNPSKTANRLFLSLIYSKIDHSSLMDAHFDEFWYHNLDRAIAHNTGNRYFAFDFIIFLI